VDAQELTLLHAGTWDEEVNWFQETLGKIVVRPGIDVGGRGKLLFGRREWLLMFCRFAVSPFR
jgi:hypothetical protein